MLEGACPAHPVGHASTNLAYPLFHRVHLPLCSCNESASSSSFQGKLEQQASQLQRDSAAAEERTAQLQQALAAVRDAQAGGERLMQQETRK